MRVLTVQSMQLYGGGDVCMKSLGCHRGKEEGTTKIRQTRTSPLLRFSRKQHVWIHGGLQKKKKKQEEEKERRRRRRKNTAFVLNFCYSILHINDDYNLFVLLVSPPLPKSFCTVNNFLRSLSHKFYNLLMIARLLYRKYFPLNTIMLKPKSSLLPLLL